MPLDLIHMYIVLYYICIKHQECLVHLDGAFSKINILKCISNK